MSLTADLAARALVGAARVNGMDPLKVFENQRGRFNDDRPRGFQTRVLAGATLRAQFGLSAAEIGRALRFHGNHLSPVSLRKFAIDADRLLDVAEIMNGLPGEVSA